MKSLYLCEVCGHLYENPNEAVLCEENGPKPKFWLGEKVYLVSPSVEGEHLEPVIIESTRIYPSFGEPQIFYILGDEWGEWPERSLRSRINH